MPVDHFRRRCPKHRRRNMVQRPCSLPQIATSFIFCFVTSSTQLQLQLDGALGSARHDTLRVVESRGGSTTLLSTPWILQRRAVCMTALPSGSNSFRRLRPMQTPRILIENRDKSSRSFSQRTSRLTGRRTRCG